MGGVVSRGCTMNFESGTLTPWPESPVGVSRAAILSHQRDNYLIVITFMVMGMYYFQYVVASSCKVLIITRGGMMGWGRWLGNKSQWIWA